MPNDGQTETSASFATSSTGVDAIEALEDPAEVFDRNAGARVAHANRRTATGLRFGAHRHAAAGCVTDGVLDEVGEDLT
jgi:hypothetical protein